jgi:hypothetical protein
LALTTAPLQLGGTEFTPDGLADGDLFGLNKRGNLILNLRGVGDATGVGVELAGISALVFLRIRFGVGEAAGESAVEDDVALSAGDAVAAAFSGTRSFDGEGDSVGVPVSSCD